MSTFYDILGISQNASTEDVKRAYRKLSLKFHPDKNEGDIYFSQMFRQINEAYNILLSDEKRRKYDFQLREQSDLKQSVERLKNLEDELAYKNQLLKRKKVFDDVVTAKPVKTINTRPSQTKFHINIKHVKYFLWVVIVGLIIAIAGKDDSFKGTKPIKQKNTTRNKTSRKKIRTILKDDIKIKEKDTNEPYSERDSILIKPEITEIILPVDTTQINE